MIVATIALSADTGWAQATTIRQRIQQRLNEALEERNGKTAPRPKTGAPSPQSPTSPHAKTHAPKRVTGPISYVAPEGMSDQAFEQLAAKATTLRRMDLSRSDVTSAGIAQGGFSSPLETLILPQPQGEPFTLTPEAAIAIARLKTLEHLDAQRTQFAGDALRHLALLHELQSIDFSGTSGYPPADLRHFLQNTPALENIDLSGTTFDGTALDALRQPSRLKSLSMRLCPLTDAGVKSITAHALVELDLSYTSIKPQHIEALGSLTRLEWLDMSGTRLRPEAWRRLAALPRLSGIALASAPVNAELMAVLPLDHLEQLDLSAARGLDETCWSYLSKATALRELTLDRTSVDGQALQTLCVLPSLNILSLADAKSIDDSAFEALSRFPKLTRIDLTQTTVSDEAVRRFKKAHPLIRILHPALSAPPHPVGRD